MNYWIIAALVAGAYLLGSIPSAVWIGKIFYGVDVRTAGSGNAGTTNVARVLGKRAAIPVFLIDTLKGFAAVELACLSGIESDTPAFYYLKMVLCVVAVLGHMFPLFAGFRGGKGVATLVGAMFGFSVGAILLCLLTFMVIVYVTHYVSVGSMVGGCMLPLFAAVCGQRDWRLICFYILVALIIVINHRKNIDRLLKGTENKSYFFKADRPKQ